jgi:hypothetical protein
VAPDAFVRGALREFLAQGVKVIIIHGKAQAP